MFKVNNKDTRYQDISHLVRSGVSTVNFECVNAGWETLLKLSVNLRELEAYYFN